MTSALSASALWSSTSDGVPAIDDTSIVRAGCDCRRISATDSATRRDASATPSMSFWNSAEMTRLEFCALWASLRASELAEL